MTQMCGDCGCVSTDAKHHYPNCKRIVVGEARDPLLVEREKTHGNFAKQGEWANTLKFSMRQCPRYIDLTGAQREAMDMIATKMSRVLFGNPKEKDHFDDIAGYAKLGAEACDG